MLGTLRTLGWVIWLFGYLIGRLPAYWHARRLDKKGDIAARDALVDKQCRNWTGKLLHHIKMHVAVQGAEHLPPPGEAVLYVANHQSFIDIPVLLNIIRPTTPLMARSEIGKVPMLGGWMRLIGCVFVQRGDVRASVMALKEAEELLKSGRSLIMFPSGTRSKSDTVGHFQPGAVRIAWKAGVRIVPVAVDGTYRGLEGNGYRVQPTDVRVIFLPPVEAKDLDKAAQKALPGQLEEMIRAAKDGPGHTGG